MSFRMLSYMELCVRVQKELHRYDGYTPEEIAELFDDGEGPHDWMDEIRRVLTTIYRNGPDIGERAKAYPIKSKVFDEIFIEPNVIPLEPMDDEACGRTLGNCWHRWMVYMN